MASEQRQALALQQTDRLLELIQQNTQLTTLVQELSKHIEVMTIQMHGKVVKGDTTL